MSKTTTMIDSPTFGRFVFDAVFKTDHTANVTLTQHPVQSGAYVSDHSYLDPDEVGIEIGMSDAAENATDSSHSVNAYTQLRAIMEAREPVTLVTRLKTYQDMVITSISSMDDYTTMYALRASIYFQHVRIVNVATVRVQQTISSSKSPSQSSGGKTSSGISSSGSNQTASSSGQSVLSKLVTAAKSSTSKSATPLSVANEKKVKAIFAA